jgi:putative transposase
VSRPPRFSYAHAVHHVTLRCNNREFLFTDSSFAPFLRILQEARARFPLRLYDYCLMTNHVHLLFKAGQDDTLSKAMHWLSTSFVRRFNKAAGRKGHLWEGRFRSTIIEEATSFFRCLAYIDLNPVRARMTATPLDYRWSGHRALRAEDAAQLDVHPLYLDLGPDPASRHRAYCELLADEAAREPFSLATVYFLGSPRFVGRLERRFGLGGRGAFLTRRLLGGGLVCVGPRRGGPPEPE